MTRRADEPRAQAADELGAETQEHQAWERGRRHGIRQARRPQTARIRELEQEVDDLLKLQEAHSRAFEHRCNRVRALEVRLEEAIVFDIPAGDERLTVYIHDDSWMLRRGDGTLEDHPDQKTVLARADQITATNDEHARRSPPTSSTSPTCGPTATR